MQFQNSVPSWVKDSCFRQLEILNAEGPFTAKPLIETNNSLTICSIPWKGKFSQIGGTKKVNTANRMKEKAECCIGDSTRTI